MRLLTKSMVRGVTQQQQWSMQPAVEGAVGAVLRESIVEGGVGSCKDDVIVEVQI